MINKYYNEKTGDETIIMNEKYKNTCIYGQHRVGIYHRDIIIDTFNVCENIFRVR